MQFPNRSILIVPQDLVFAVYTGRTGGGTRTGSTHSFFDHTPDPKGQLVRPTRVSNKARQYSGPYIASASILCSTSSKDPSVALYMTSSREKVSAGLLPSITLLKGTKFASKRWPFVKGAA